jgi:hypothetical protein
MMIYYLYIHSYMFRSYDHHQAEKYIATLGLLNWQRIRCFIRSYVIVIVYMLLCIVWYSVVMGDVFSPVCIFSVPLHHMGHAFLMRPGLQPEWILQLAVVFGCCAVFIRLPWCVFWFWQCSVVLCFGSWWGCAILCVSNISSYDINVA